MMELKYGTMPVARVGIHEGQYFCLRCFDMMTADDFKEPFVIDGELVCWHCRMCEEEQISPCPKGYSDCAEWVYSWALDGTKVCRQRNDDGAPPKGECYCPESSAPPGSTKQNAGRV